MKKILFLFVSVFLVFSCSNIYTKNDSANKTTLENTSWKLIKISEDKIPPKTDNERFGEFTLNFDTDNLYGNSGINTFGGGYTLENGVLAAKHIIGTLMAGPENLMKLENRYLKVLNNIKSYKINNNTLTIKSDTDTLTFQKVK